MKCDEAWSPALPVTDQLLALTPPKLSELPYVDLFNDDAPQVNRSDVSDFDLDAVIHITGKQLQSLAVAQHIVKVAGQTFWQCCNMTWVDNKGQQQKYTVSHFKYDLSQGVLSTALLLVPAPVSVMAAWAVVGQEVHCAMLSLTGAEPHNHCEGLQWADWPCWFAAEQCELAVLEWLRCWEYVPQSAVPVGQ